MRPSVTPPHFSAPRISQRHVMRRWPIVLTAALSFSLALGGTPARAQRATMAPDPGVTPAVARAPADSAVGDAPFAGSLQILPPGPQAEPDGMSFRLTLAWSARPGAATYRVFTWTDAVRGWYRTAQVTATRVDVHAFRSGCTAFIVVAVSDPNSGGNSLLGLETTNVVRFPLSARPELCPVKAE